MACIGLERLRARTGEVRWWNVFAWVLLVGGIALTIFGSVAWTRTAQSQARQSFRAEAESVGSTVTSALRRMDDLMVAARTLVEANPRLTNLQLRAWYRNIGARDRYREAIGFGYVQRVPAAELQRYAALVRADPVPGFPAVGETLKVTPPGTRPDYCFIRLALAGAFGRLIPGAAGFDLCAVPGASSFLASPGAGRIGAVPASIPTLGQTLIVSAPLYRGGSTPPDAATRRSRALGWIVGVFDLGSVLDAAVGPEHDLAVSIFRRSEAPPASPGSTRSTPPELGRLTSVATAGPADAHAPFRSRFVLDADGRWVVTVAASPHWGWLSPTRQRIVVLGGGILISVLVFLLVQVLARGRARALRMVAAKTDELRYQALHDSLTGLPNRTLLLDRAGQVLARAARQRSTPSALYVDIDGFKHVNDTFGHAVGDAVLRAVGSRLSSAVRAADTVARLGGDEFIVLLDSATLDASAELVAERLLEVISQPIDLHGVAERPLSVTVSIGVAVGARETADELIRDADLALYRAKETGRNRCAFYESGMHTVAQDYLRLEMDLRDALAREQLFLLYQPTFDLQNERLTGVEALLRWRHPTRGVIEPDTFIPIAEKSGAILSIGRWVLHQACRQAAAWRRDGHRIGMAVNVSGRQLENDQLVGDILDALRSSGLEAEALTLEITETALMRDTAVASRRLTSLKKLGVQIAIDDFGTGYSSLAYLRQFPVDALKIDRSFVAGIAASKESGALVHTLVQLGKTLGLQTLGEGIEDQAQLRHLQREQCDFGQGFLLARPLEPETIERFLDSAGARQARSSSVFRAVPEPRPAG